VLMPTSQLAAAKGVRTVPLDTATRQQAQQQASAVQQVALQRSRTELPSAPGKPIQPRTAALHVPPARPVTSGIEAASGTRPSTGMVKTAPPSQTGATLRTPTTAAGSNVPSAAANRPGLSGPPQNGTTVRSTGQPNMQRPSNGTLLQHPQNQLQ